MTAHEKGMHRFWGEFFCVEEGGGVTLAGDFCLFAAGCGRMWPEYASDIKSPSLRHMK